MTIIQKARVDAPKEKQALIDEKIILQTNLVPFYKSVKVVNTDAIQTKDLAKEVLVRENRIATITKLLPEYDAYIARLNNPYPRAIVTRDLTPDERAIFPLTMNTQGALRPRFSATKIFEYFQETISDSREIPILTVPEGLSLGVISNGVFSYSGDNLFVASDQVDADGNPVLLVDYSFEQDGDNSVVFTKNKGTLTYKIVYVKFEAVFAAPAPIVLPSQTFTLARNQTFTSTAFNTYPSVQVTDASGLDVNVVTGAAQYPYNQQLVLVKQANQLVMVANDMTRTITVTASNFGPAQPA